VQRTSNQRFKKVLKKGKKELGKENKVMLSLHPAREKKFVEKADKF
jgi:isoprenylcysteine carboxyl methyltransferase (ICMT) family protein YpbQ